MRIKNLARSFGNSLAAIGAALFLVGCGNNSPSGGTDSQGTAGEQVTGKPAENEGTGSGTKEKSSDDTEETSPSAKDSGSGSGLK